MSRSMRRALAIHAENAAAFLDTAARISDERWAEPRAEGKWSPAEVSAHLVQTYGVVIGELQGGAGMAIRTSRWQQLLLRLLFGWRILYFGRFPRGVRAPRETRPTAGLPKSEALALFRQRADEFEEAAGQAPPGRKVSHAYFGRGSAVTGILLSARHIEHHRRQIE